MEGSGDKVGTKIWWRHWSVVLILAVMAAIIIWFLINLGPWLRIWQENKAAKAVQEQLDKAYRSDKYGGKTPQETLNLLITALENGNIELASRYFIIEKQAAWMKALATYKNQALLGNFIKELKSLPFDKSMFQLYPSGVWKIDSL